MNDPDLHRRFVASLDALFGPDPGERAGNWRACREHFRIARVAVR